MQSSRPLLALLRRYWLRYVIGAACIVASQWLKLQIPRHFWGILEELRELKLTDASIDSELVVSSIGKAALWILAAALIIAPIRTSSRILILGASRRFAHDLLQRVFDHMLLLAPSFYVRNPTGQLMSRCINDRNYVRSLGGPVFMYMAETITLYAISVPLMLSIDVRLATLALLPYPVFLVIARVLALKIQRSVRAAQEALGQIAEKTDESLSGQLVIKTLCIEDNDRERFEERCREYRAHNLRVTKIRAVLIALMMGLAALSTTLVISLGGPAVMRGELDFADFGVLLTYLAWLAVPTRTLGFVISSLRRGLAAYDRIVEVLDTEPELRDPEQQSTPPRVRAGALSLRDLTVKYPPLSEQPHLSGSLPDEVVRSDIDEARTVLRDVCLEVPAGTTLGVVGHTGSGKTTLARVLARQLEIGSDQVFVDGVELHEYPLHEVRGATGYVPQEAFLFSASVAENVALGRPDASDEEILAAVNGAQLGADLDQLPDGLDTMLGERGVNLSGGQRQRTALARVLLLSPKLLILDDTLSAVDTHTADAILEHLRPFASERTTVLIAHRLSTVRHAEQIIVLEEGQVVERGTHAELLDLDGRYAATWAKQERNEERAEENTRLERELDEGLSS